MKRRVRVATRNLELCFPQMDAKARREMVVKNFESVGMGVMETGMAWFWSDKRMARWSEVTGTGMDPVHQLQANKTVADDKLSGYFLVGNARYPITGARLDEAAELLRTPAGFDQDGYKILCKPLLTGGYEITPLSGLATK
jgi:hypothetical protein